MEVVTIVYNIICNPFDQRLLEIQNSGNEKLK